MSFIISDQEVSQVKQSGLYGSCRGTMLKVMNDLTEQIQTYGRAYENEQGTKLFEHLTCRIKNEESMREKLRRLGLEEDTRNALRSVTDSVGIRVVCLFIDDVYENVRRIQSIPGCRVVTEKDYIQNAKPNGYRSYHMILDVETDEADAEGNTPGHYYAEIQLRTIAMDTWAALEHEMKYKKEFANQELIIQELRRCANELASCDVSMQTLKRMIREGKSYDENSAG